MWLSYVNISFMAYFYLQKQQPLDNYVAWYHAKWYQVTYIRKSLLYDCYVILLASAFINFLQIIKYLTRSPMPPENAVSTSNILWNFYWYHVKSIVVFGYVKFGSCSISQFQDSFIEAFFGFSLRWIVPLTNWKFKMALVIGYQLYHNIQNTTWLVRSTYGVGCEVSSRFVRSGNGQVVTIAAEATFAAIIFMGNLIEKNEWLILRFIKVVLNHFWHSVVWQRVHCCIIVVKFTIFISTAFCRKSTQL